MEDKKIIVIQDSVNAVDTTQAIQNVIQQYYLPQHLFPIQQYDIQGNPEKVQQILDTLQQDSLVIFALDAATTQNLTITSSTKLKGLDKTSRYFSINPALNLGKPLEISSQPLQVSSSTNLLDPAINYLKQWLIDNYKNQTKFKIIGPDDNYFKDISSFFPQNIKEEIKIDPNITDQDTITTLLQSQLNKINSDLVPNEFLICTAASTTNKSYYINAFEQYFFNNPKHIGVLFTTVDSVKTLRDLSTLKFFPIAVISTGLPVSTYLDMAWEALHIAQNKLLGLTSNDFKEVYGPLGSLQQSTFNIYPTQTKNSRISIKQQQIQTISTGRRKNGVFTLSIYNDTTKSWDLNTIAKFDQATGDFISNTNTIQQETQKNILLRLTKLEAIANEMQSQISKFSDDIKNYSLKSTAVADFGQTLNSFLQLFNTQIHNQTKDDQKKTTLKTLYK